MLKETMEIFILLGVVVVVILITIDVKDKY